MWRYTPRTSNNCGGPQLVSGQSPPDTPVYYCLVKKSMSGRPTAQGAINGKTKASLVTGSQVAQRHLQEFEWCQQRGDIGRSFSHLSLALCILPHLKTQYYTTYLEVFEDWIAKVEENNGFQESMTIFEVALNHYPDSPDLHHLLAKTLSRHGSVREAWNYACLAQVECPRDPNVQETRSRLTNALVDRWHLPMLNDSTRNGAFKLAIERAMECGHQTVLDIGSGTGLLSIFAKQAGAREVYACEVDKFMYEMAQNILQSNLNPPGIHTVNHHSKDIVIPSHIPEKVSLVVTETVDAGLFGEHILDTLEHAWKHLLLPPPPSVMFHELEAKTPPVTFQSETSHSLSSTTSPTFSVKNAQSHIEEDKNTESVQIDKEILRQSSSEFGRVIPTKAEVFVALISCDYISRQSKIINSDLLYFKNKNICIKLQEPYMSERLNQVPGGFRMLSQWTLLTTMDFNSYDDIKRHLTGEINKALELQCIEDGSLDAIVLAFNLYLDEEHHISTLPNPSTTLWENAVYPVTNVIRVNTHDIMTVDFHCTGVIRLSIQDHSPAATKYKDSVYLSESAIRFLNSKSFVNAFVSAAQQAILCLKQQPEKEKYGRSRPLIICDTTPFPVAGLALQSELSNSQLYVEDEELKNTLQELGITAHLSEDLEEEVDILFLWPVTTEGTLKDGLVKKIITYRLMMAENGMVFPQEVDLILSAISSPLLAAMTRVDHLKTSIIKIK
ncbi:protein arginine N-methyltransferase 9-like isoform X2 [Homarus americanus]|uniref:protein arginine N-methyltransferase 9-like isoform X2 n=1 Tax=Homarus americanus TaxID=6706 RepID=UPI001C475ECC|nr:protein arginine N-methyltransferase 9-like isoform X2 [Homarus americanus]